MNETIKIAREQEQQAYNNALNMIGLLTNQPNYAKDMEQINTKRINNKSK